MGAFLAKAVAHILEQINETARWPPAGNDRNVDYAGTCHSANAAKFSNACRDSPAAEQTIRSLERITQRSRIRPSPGGVEPGLQRSTLRVVARRRPSGGFVYLFEM